MDELPYASRLSNKGSVYVNCITIDDFVEEKQIYKVDFIKMDIEGAEEEALLGAKHTILKHKPKLAICIYHKARAFLLNSPTYKIIT